MTDSRVLVRVRDDAHARIAWAVASIPGRGPVGMLGHRPPTSWRHLVRRAKDSTATDIVVDPDPDDAGVVVVAGTTDRPGVTNASPEGLARCLLARLDGDGVAAWTTVGVPRRTGTPYAFPAPLGTVRGEPGDLPTPGPFAGVGAFGAGRAIVCVDDRPFMEAICMAAGAGVASPQLSRPTPVWEHASVYIEACETLGLVLAETVSP